MNYKELNLSIKNSSHNLVKLQILFSFLIIVGKEFKKINSLDEEIVITKMKQQLIKEPTQVTDNSQTMLDHIWVNNTMNLSAFGVLDIAVSDHKPIFMRRKINYIYKCNKKVQELITFRDCKNLNKERLKSSIESMKQIDVNESDVNRSLNQFNRDITHIINEQIPIKTNRMKDKRPLNWFNNEIKKLMQIRDKFFRSYCESMTKNCINLVDKENYKKYRNKVISAIRLSKHNTIMDSIQKNNVCQKKNML
jgi:hypothetical protein